MTYAAPNPGGFDPFFRQRVEEKIAESRRGAGEPDPGTDPETPPDPGDFELPEPEGPFTLDRLREHEVARAAARQDGRAADEASRLVAADLAQLLELVRDQVRETGKGPSRQRVRTVAPKVKSAAEQAFGEVADLLNLPGERVAEVTRLLVRDGGVAPAQRHQALKDLDWLRARVREAAVTGDQAALDGALEFAVRLAVLRVTGGPSVKDVVCAGFAALAAFALREAAGFTRTPAAVTVPDGEVPDGVWGKVVAEVRECAAEIAGLLRQR